ncbi:MAG: iron uptake transporter permease EfeU [Micromonosporaceae bacterium]
MLASYLIGLREGLEAALVVTILVAFLVKSGRRSLLRLVWSGVALAVAVSVALAVSLTYVWSHLDTYRQRELFEAVISVAAVCFVTWMIFWMRRAARSIKGDLHARLDHAIAVGPVAVTVVAFLAVAREGLETAVLFLGAVQGSVTSAGPMAGLALGLATAIVLGALLYWGALRINLGHFFTWTGVLLIFVAAGILRYGIHDFQEAGVLPQLGTAFDASAYYDQQSWYASLITGMFNIVAAPTWLEVIGYLAYLLPVLVIFLWPAARPSKPAVSAPAAAPGPSAPAAPAPAPEQSTSDTATSEN